MPESKSQQKIQELEQQLKQFQQKIEGEIKKLSQPKTLEISVPSKERFSNLVDDLGIIEAVSSVPTHIPVHPLKKIVIYSSGGVWRIYIFDSVGRVWKYATLS